MVMTRPFMRTGGNLGSPKFNLAGCVLYAPLWRPELAGSPFQSSGVYGIPTHTCTVTGALWTPQGRTFDGLNDIINCGSATVIDNLLTTLSIGGWAYPETQGESGFGYFIECGALNNRGFGFYMNSDARFSFRILNGAVPAEATSALGTMSLNAWHHFFGTYDGVSTIKLYIDGVQYSAVGNGAIDAHAVDNFIIGGRSDGSLCFDGIGGEVVAFNREMSSGEVLQHLQETKWRYMS